MEYGTELTVFSSRKEETKKVTYDSTKLDEKGLEETACIKINLQEEEKKQIPQETKSSDQNGKNTLNCSKCLILLSFPEGSYFVSCPICSTITATIELLSLNCQFCRNLSYFPKKAQTVQCGCGAVYLVSN